MTQDITVHVAVYNTLADWEIGYLTAALDSDAVRDPTSIRVRMVGASTDPIRTKGGLTVVPDITLADLDPADSSMLVLPGADTWLSGGLTEFSAAARGFIDAGVPVAAICGAVFGLATAGLLDHRTHTAADKGLLAATGYRGGELFRDEPSHSDGQVITASPVAPIEFARDALEVLGVSDPRKLDAWFRLYRHQEPAAYYDLVGA